MIVIDASAAVSALLNDGPARSALADTQVHVPHLIDSEIANVLRRQVRTGTIDAATAWTLLDTWRRIGVRRETVSGLLQRIWELRDNLSAYDATYVALAEQLGYPLMSADARLARAPGTRCPITVVPR